jgi:GxxExxY protein
MPILCPITFPRLSTEEFRPLDYAIMECAFASHKELGRLVDEKIYQSDFTARLVASGYEVHREVPITVTFRSFVKIYYIDVVVISKAIYELKTVSKLTSEHEAQVMNYLLLVNCGHGKMINFRPASVDWRFVNAPLTLDERRAFSVDARRWLGDDNTKNLIVELLRDWGTALELPLYYQAMIHLLGGESVVTKQLPVQRGGIPLGNHRFHLMEPQAAFRITAFNEISIGYETHVKRLLKLSQLKAIHWINIGYHEVTFTTIA